MKLCPNCRVELVGILPGGVQYDECTRCKGIYYDREELRQAKDLAEPDANWLDFDMTKAIGERRHDSRSGLSCPGCEGEMAATEYQDTGVTIDACPSCSGAWLDKGEFEKIIRALNEQLNTMTFGEYVPRALREGLEIITGPEGLASEWADFKMVLHLMSLRLYIERAL